MPKVKYSRFKVPVLEDEVNMELPGGPSQFHCEVIDGNVYIAAIYPSDAVFKTRTISFLYDGVEFEADAVVDIGLAIVPGWGERRVVMLGMLPPAVKVARDAARAGIIGARSLPGH